jgi:glucose-1-phosphate adenylyltransferase
MWTDIGNIDSFEANIGLTDDVPKFNLLITIIKFY